MKYISIYCLVICFLFFNFSKNKSAVYYNKNIGKKNLIESALVKVKNKNKLSFIIIPLGKEKTRIIEINKGKDTLLQNIPLFLPTEKVKELGLTQPLKISVLYKFNADSIFFNIFDKNGFKAIDTLVDSKLK